MTAPCPEADGDSPWLRLSGRVIGVDLLQSIVSLVPAVVALWIVETDPGAGQVWPLLAVAAFGLLGAITDALRWGFTRYRITPTHVEVTSGVLRRVHRSMPRDRIRSVDSEAKLRHRLAGLRVVRIGAGQQTAEGAAALALDALGAADARALQHRLLGPGDRPAPAADADAGAGAPATPERTTPERTTPERTAPLVVLARFEPRWIVFNMFNAWAYVLALGVGWGGYWLLGSFGVDVTGFVTGLADWDAIGWAGTAAIAFGAVTVVGAVGLAVNHVAEYWDFELARVRGPDGTLLRTRQGLLTTREVDRDENRIRGVQISEPVLWRWMGASDTSVITTGLSLWAMSQPAAILPRTPVRTARRVAAEVLGTGEPFDAPLAAHPPGALRRRLWWGTAVAAGVGLVLAWLAATGVVPPATIWAAAVVWPCALGAAVVAYRALGHAISGDHLVTRSGLSSRATTVLQRSAVSTIVIRESLLQRRLGLRSVSAMTAAGSGGYDTPDLDAGASVAFAARAAPGVLDPFLTGADSPRRPDPDVGPPMARRARQGI